MASLGGTENTRKKPMSQRLSRAAVIATVALVAIASSAIAPTSAEGQQGGSSTATLTVHAVVVRNCTVVASPVDFGNYDPLVANRTQPLDSMGTVTVECTRGTAPTVELDLGSNADGTTRRMSEGTEFLVYELYSDPGRTTIWGTGSQGVKLPASPGIGGGATPETIYGRIDAGQNAAPGDYNDTVNVTVIF